MKRHLLVKVVLAGIATSSLTACRRGDPVTAVTPSQTISEAARSLAQSVQQLIRRGRVDVEVEELASARTRLESSLTSVGGRIERLQTNEDLRAEYTLRVPANRLDAMMDSTATLGEVKARTVSATDVSEQVVDAEARLVALRASRDRLRQLLERATTVQEVITVERELARVQGELESLEGRLNALRGQVAMSELAVLIERRRVLGPVGVVLQGVGVAVGKLFVWR